ncbi:MAG: CRISPR-associated endonuclease Cas2 [Pseudomonadota bacterium]|nr:CRISPR-associated endonuclease Cas2 [Pseudomonadota bacterium]
MPRTLYLVAYDVRDPRRLARVGRYFQSYRVAGQKSVPEIWVTPGELQAIQRDIGQLIDQSEDRLQLIALDPRMQRQCLGKAATFRAPYFCVV